MSVPVVNSHNITCVFTMAFWYKALCLVWSSPWLGAYSAMGLYG